MQSKSSALPVLLLVIAAVLFYPKIASLLNPNNPNPVPVTPVNPIPNVTPDPQLVPIAAPIGAKLAGKAEVAKDFADFYLDLKDSISRDTGAKVYPTTDRFVKVHSTALYACFQSRATHQGFDLGPTIDATLQASLGGLEPKAITEKERGQIIKALDTIIYTLQQVK